MAPYIIPAVQADLRNPPWASAAARVLIVRLSPFPDVNRSTPHLFLFAECRQILPDAYVDFACLPEQTDRRRLSAQGQPWFAGAASGRSVAEFDLVLISNACVLELVNLPYLFTTAGLPLFAAERGRAGGRRPLVILGGANALAAGALVRPDGDALVDGIFFGEGEGAVRDLIRILADPRKPADERLARAAAVRGFWAAGATAPVEKSIVRPVSECTPLTAYPVLNSREASTARLQITHGCPAFCSFCLQGWERKPYREVPLAQVLRAARALKENTGASTLEVYSYNFNMHAEVFALLLELNRLFRRMSRSFHCSIAMKDRAAQLSVRTTGEDGKCSSRHFLPVLECGPVEVGLCGALRLCSAG